MTAAPLDFIIEELGVSGAAADTTFAAGGADSLSLLSLTRAVQSRFGVRIPIRELFGELDTPRKLAGRLAPAPDRPAEPAARPEPHRPAAPPNGTVSPPNGTVSPPNGTVSPPNGTVSPQPVAEPELLALFAAQLELSEKLMDSFTSLARQQLQLLGSQPAEPALPAAPTTEAVLPAQAALPAQGAAPEFSLYFFGNYPRTSAAPRYQDLIAAAEFADRNDFAGIWIPERHFHPFGGLFPNPSVVAAAIASRTSRIRLNAGSVVLPLHNTIRAAEEWSVVDNLSNGRVGISFASGWHSTDFVLAPQHYQDSRKVMREQIRTFRQLWSGAALTVESGDGSPVEIRLHPAPVQPEPPLHLAVLSNPESYEQAARQGLGVVTNLMAQSVDDLRANIARYRRARAEFGLDPAAGRVVVLVHTHLDADHQTARDRARRPFKEYLRSSLDLFDSVANSLGLEVDLNAIDADDLEVVLDRAYDRYCESRALIGDRASCQARVAELVDAGADEIGCFIDFGVEPEHLLGGLDELNELRKRYLRPAAATPPPATTPPPGTGSWPATRLQQRMWTVDRLNPGSHAYYEPKALLLHGPLNVPALRAAFQRVIERHPQLRTVFADDGRTVSQRPLAAVRVPLPSIDLPGLTEAEAICRLRDSQQKFDFDLAIGPLIRAVLGRLDDDRYLLYLLAHHIVFDAQSTVVFVRDLAAYYQAAVTGAGTAASLPSCDLVEVSPDPDRQRESREYWRHRLASAMPLLLPTDRPRAAGGGQVRGATVVRELDAALARRVREFSGEHGCTAFTTVLSSLAAVLGRFAGQQDVLLATAVANRPPHAEHAVGMFVETVALRLPLAQAPDFAALVAIVGDRLLEALEHGDVPFDEVVDAVGAERVAGRDPLLRVMVEYEEAAPVVFDAAGVVGELAPVPRNEAPFDLSFYFQHAPQGISCAVEYDSALFDETSVSRILDYLEAVLGAAIQAPDQPLSRLGALTPGDAELIESWQGPTTGDDGACLHHLVTEQARRHPDLPAIIGTGQPVTYGQLDRDADALARRLAGNGVGPGSTLALDLPRGAEMIRAMLAALKAGAAYVCLDRSLPVSRRRQLIGDTRAGAVLSDRGDAAAELGTPGCPVLALEGPDPDHPDPVHPDPDHPDPVPAGAAEVAADPDATAYFICTSGSSGGPKAVAVPHRSVVNLARWQHRQLGALRTAQWTAATFDVSVQEIFTTLASGSVVVVVDDRLRHDPAEVAAVLREHQVERICLPFTPFKYFAAELAGVPSLRQALIAGEKLTVTPELLRFMRRRPDVAVYNQYGPTEASVIVTSQRVEPVAGAEPPIGGPIDNVRLAVVDAGLAPVPIGVVGELLIGGVAVARGYANDAEASAAAFRADLAALPGRWYRTGDLVRWRNEATLDYLGRTDDQVKIRGNRVEPAETERALAQLEGVREAAVLARRNKYGDLELVAFVVPHDRTGEPDLAGRLRARLSATLPSCLVPDVFVPLERLPYSDNGKLDRIRLLATGPAEPELHRSVRELWSLELGLDTVPLDRSFFELGGNSLSAIRLLERVRSSLGHQIAIKDFFAAPTVTAMAARLADRSPA